MQEAIQKHIILQSQVRIAPGKRFGDYDAQQDVPYASNKQVKQLEIQDSGPKKLFLLTEDGRFRCTIRDMQGTPIVEIRAYSPVSSNILRLISSCVTWSSDTAFSTTYEVVNFVSVTMVESSQPPAFCLQHLLAFVC